MIIKAEHENHDSGHLSGLWANDAKLYMVFPLLSSHSHSEGDNFVWSLHRHAGRIANLGDEVLPFATGKPPDHLVHRGIVVALDADRIEIRG